MGYYLSQRNREIINAIEKILRETSKDIELPTETPERLSYILRNAANTQEFRWIKDKFILKVGQGRVICRIRAPRIEDIQVPTILNNETETPSLQFFDIASDLIKSNSSNTIGESKQYNTVPLNEEEVEKLRSYCELIGYYFFYENNIVKVIRK